VAVAERHRSGHAQTRGRRGGVRAARRSRLKDRCARREGRPRRGTDRSVGRAAERIRRAAERIHRAAERIHRAAGEIRRRSDPRSREEFLRSGAASRRRALPCLAAAVASTSPWAASHAGRAAGRRRDHRQGHRRGGPVARLPVRIHQVAGRTSHPPGGARTIWVRRSAGPQAAGYPFAAPRISARSACPDVAHPSAVHRISARSAAASSSPACRLRLAHPQACVDGQAILVPIIVLSPRCGERSVRAAPTLPVAGVFNLHATLRQRDA
jgi:hypothetical protein